MDRGVSPSETVERSLRAALGSWRGCSEDCGETANNRASHRSSWRTTGREKQGKVIAMDDSRPPSTASQLESSLELAIERLTRVVPTSETKRLLIEGRRLRSLMANWRSIPPSQEVRREMLSRVMHLAAAAAEVAPSIAMPAPSYKEPAIHAVTAALTQPSVVAVLAPAGPPRTLVTPGIAVVRPDQFEAEHLEGVPGVEIRFLPSPGPGGLRCAVVKMLPGAELPARGLPGGEALYMVEGVACMGEIEIAAGEVCYAEPETVHVAIRTERGCKFFVVAPDDGEAST
jgi:hypothetical protein